MSFLGNIFEDTSASTILLTSLDILIVYYVIYRVLLTIKGTRADLAFAGTAANLTENSNTPT